MGDITQPIRTHAQQFAQGSTNASNQNVYGSTGVYRTGGPTTHFGGAGLGPFDDRYYLSLSVNTGPSSFAPTTPGSAMIGTGGAARRAALLRQGVGEENWMWKVALMVHESNDQYAAIRPSRLRGAALSVAPPPRKGWVAVKLRHAGTLEGRLFETSRAARRMHHRVR